MQNDSSARSRPCQAMLPGQGALYAVDQTLQVLLGQRLQQTPRNGGNFPHDLGLSLPAYSGSRPGLVQIELGRQLRRTPGQFATSRKHRPFRRMVLGQLEAHSGGATNVGHPDAQFDDETLIVFDLKALKVRSQGGELVGVGQERVHVFACSRYHEFSVGTYRHCSNLS